MVKVGKINLTPGQKKRTFHLPIQQSVIVPSTSGVKTQTKLTQVKLNKRVNNVRTFLSKRFGGYTSFKATGGFVLRNGKLVKERVVKVTSFSTKQDFKKHGPEVIKQVGSWGKKWKQESVSYQNEGDLFIIEPSKRGSPKVMKKVVGKRMVKVKIPKRKKRKAITKKSRNLSKKRRRIRR